MNLLLFDPAETAVPLPRTDLRAVHLLTVLRRREGDTFDAGLVDGPRGKGTLITLSPAALTLAFAWDEAPPPLDPVTLLVGLPRPQTARDVLRDATTLGAAQLHFVATARTDPNYATSSLWTSGEWRRHCLAGAAQAFDTRLPGVTWNHSLSSVLAALPPASQRLALDNYEAEAHLAKSHPIGDSSGGPLPVVLAFGPERGWGPADRDLLRSNGFTLAHLGSRVLRVETAVVAALALVQTR